MNAARRSDAKEITDTGTPGREAPMVITPRALARLATQIVREIRKRAGGRKR
jgi:hypothetical protein